MSGLKLLYRRYFSHRRILLGSALFFAAMTAAVFVFHSDPGDPDVDYIMCKVCAQIPVVFGLLLPGIFMVQDTMGNRFMRSVPCARGLYMRGIPLFSTITAACWSAALNVIYAAFILLTGRDICNISDMLIITSIMAGLMAFVICAAMCLRLGSLLLVEFYAPLMFLSLAFIGSDTAENGFGLPLWAGLLICCGTFLAVLALGALTAGIAYAKGNFREVTYIQGTM